MTSLTMDGDVATIRLDDPQTMNAISAETTQLLRKLAQEAARTARVLIVAGGERFFSAGGNLTDIDPDALGELDAGIALRDDFNPLMLAMRELPIPWLAAVRGAAAGGGAGLALSADLIVAGESAYFLQAFVHIGLVPDCGASYLLSRAVGRARAMELMLLGERLPARRALEWGLVNRVVSDTEVEDTAREIAHRIAKGPYKALALTRRLVWEGGERSFAEHLQREAEMQSQASADADFAEGLGSFLAKRPPKFSGRHQ